jgi:hypothetical protein
MLCLGLFMTETTSIFRKVMRFPKARRYSERNDKLCSDNACYVFASCQRMELGLKQAVVYQPRPIQYLDSKQTDIQKFQNDSLPFRMWINSLLKKDSIVRCQKMLCLFFLQILNCFKYKNTICKINKVASTKRSIVSKHCRGCKKL